MPATETVKCYIGTNNLFLYLSKTNFANTCSHKNNCGN